jgi:hypothetical protein
LLQVFDHFILYISTKVAFLADFSASAVKAENLRIQILFITTLDAIALLLAMLANTPCLAPSTTQGVWTLTALLIMYTFIQFATLQALLLVSVMNAQIYVSAVSTP